MIMIMIMIMLSVFLMLPLMLVNKDYQFIYFIELCENCFYQVKSSQKFN